MRLSHWQSWFRRAPSGSNASRAKSSTLQAVRCNRRRLCAALGFCCSLAWSSLTHAESPRILLVRAPDVPNELAQSAAEDLERVGQIMDPRGYLTAAQKQHLEPTSEAALTRLGPQVGARLLVTLDAAHGKLRVTYRDGRTGAVVTAQNLPLHGKRAAVPPHAAHMLSATTRHILAKLGRQHTSDAIPSSETAAPPPVRDREPPRPPPPAAEEVSPAAAPEETQPAPPVAAEPDTDDSSSSEAWTGYASAAGGVGARAVRVPTRAGGSPVDTGFSFPAIELGLGAQGMFGSHWLLSAQVQYRVMFGIGVNELLASGAIVHTSLSSHSVVAGVAPGYRFGERDSADLRLVLAWTFRGLYPGDASVPGGSIQGPLVRPELRIPFANGLFTLRLAPEVILVIASTPTLEANLSTVHSIGFGFGGDASLDIRVSEAVQLGLEYRESHVSIASDWGNSYSDLERYGMLRLGIVF
jgi:hypothetical protein